MTVPDGKLDQATVLDQAPPARATLPEISGWPMLLCQVALGILVLLVWQGASSAAPSGPDDTTSLERLIFADRPLDDQTLEAVIALG